jgi:hypothetical protein
MDKTIMLGIILIASTGLALAIYLAALIAPRPSGAGESGGLNQWSCDSVFRAFGHAALM